MSIFWEHHHKSPLMRTETICSCPLNIFSNVNLWLAYIAPGFFFRGHREHILYIYCCMDHLGRMSSSGYQHFCVLGTHANLLKVFSTFIFAILAIGTDSKFKIFTSI